MQSSLVGPLFFSENVFALIWIMLAFNLGYIIDSDHQKSKYVRMAPLLIIVIGMFFGTFWMFGKTAIIMMGDKFIFSPYGRHFFSSLFLLIAVLINAWRLEAFWRALDLKLRKQYEYLVIGFFLIAGTVGWSASFRLTYLYLKSDHLLLLSTLLITAWFIVGYAIAGSRLLNRKIFVSRKIVYSSIAPFVFSLYLITLGLISLLMKTYGWSLSFVLQWLIIVAGLLLIAGLGFSHRIRDRIKYFISTHFYVNKYEYRDEWLAFSDLLHRRLTEKGVVEALRHILHDSLYTDIIKIWIADDKEEFRLIDMQGGQNGTHEAKIFAGDPLVAHLKSAPYLYCPASVPGSGDDRIISENKDFFSSQEIVLLVPLSIGDHFLGIIGLGPEYTGGKYGKDDFDLLSALSSQAASALLAVRTAEELARVREKSAWEALAAFVLHDIKNAATMLSLLRDNAPLHIHKLEFQQDMLASVDAALKRMAKVQARLSSLKDEIVPIFKSTDISQMLRKYSQHLAEKLSDLTIDLKCPDEIRINTDADFLAVIIENIVLNALEAVGGKTCIQITVEEVSDQNVLIKLSDNGPGILPAMLPDRLFEPFVTGKPKGSGIGLWQAKRLIESLHGKIEAKNSPEGGALFCLEISK